MSAHLAHLEPRLMEAVLQQAVNLAEAWSLQDLMLQLSEGQVVELPPALRPAWDKLELLEVPPFNDLPI